MRNKKSVILKSYVLLLSVYIHNLCTYRTGLSPFITRDVIIGLGGDTGILGDITVQYTWYSYAPPPPMMKLLSY